MERTDAKRQAIIERGPSSKPYAKIIKRGGVIELRCYSSSASGYICFL
jgi:hypothetical protein